MAFSDKGAPGRQTQLPVDDLLDAVQAVVVRIVDSQNEQRPLEKWILLWNTRARASAWRYPRLLVDVLVENRLCARVCIEHRAAHRWVTAELLPLTSGPRPACRWPAGRDRKIRRQ